MPDILEYIEALKASDRLGGLVAHHEVVAGREAVFDRCRRPWPVSMETVLERRGIGALYAHQARAMDVLRSGRSVVAATPTASGKTLIYNMPVVEQILGNPDSRALYLFPLKALAQDQLRGFEELAAGWPGQSRPTAAIYDGDTTQHFRKKIRDNPPNVLMTNPEMLHLALLPYHEKWAAFFAGLTHVVVDEVHTYRGVLGSHMAQVFRRLRRVCARYGARPDLCRSCSATIGNPAELCRACSPASTRMAGVILEIRGRARRIAAFHGPEPRADHGRQPVRRRPSSLLRAALARGLRTIVYCGVEASMTELISIWAARRRAGKFKRTHLAPTGPDSCPRNVARSRRAWPTGELLAVISTSRAGAGHRHRRAGRVHHGRLPGFDHGRPCSGAAAWDAVSRDSAVALIAQRGRSWTSISCAIRTTSSPARPSRAMLNPFNPRGHGPAPGLRGRRADLCGAGEPWLLAEEAGGPAGGGRFGRGRDNLFEVERGPAEDIRPRSSPTASARIVTMDLRGSGGQYSIVTIEDNSGDGSADPAKERRSSGQIDQYRAFKRDPSGRGLSAPGADLSSSGRHGPGRDQRGPRRGPSGRGLLHASRAWSKDTRRFSKSSARRPRFRDCACTSGGCKVTDQITGYEKRRARARRQAARPSCRWTCRPRSIRDRGPSGSRSAHDIPKRRCEEEYPALHGRHPRLRARGHRHAPAAWS